MYTNIYKNLNKYIKSVVIIKIFKNSSDDGTKLFSLQNIIKK